jgi:hypothetical protein
LEQLAEARGDDQQEPGSDDPLCQDSCRLCLIGALAPWSTGDSCCDNGMVCPRGSFSRGAPLGGHGYPT